MLSRCLMLASCLLTLSAAQAYFEGCDNAYTLQAGVSVFESPYYPQNYPPGTSCRYKVTAPPDHNIKIQCTISLPSNNGQCTTDNFWIDSEGHILMQTAENFCGSGSFSRESLFTELTFAYISTGSNSGRFRCTLNVQPQPCNCGWSASPRISNGQQAAINEYPSMVALKDTTSNLRSFCGGAIVAHRFIVTAAHCLKLVQQAINIVAIVGTNNLENPSSSIYYAQYAIQQSIVHENYQTDPTLVNDIAILVTAISIKWTRGVGPICLPPAGTTNNFANNVADIIGFGTTYFAGPASITLQKVTLLVVTNQDCKIQYEGQAEISSGHMCTYDYAGQKQDSCQHDSGGPLILRSARQYLLGTISFGNACASQSYSMGVNTRITTYLNWILQKIGYTNCAVAM